MNASSPLFFPAWTWTTVDLLNHLWQSTAVAVAVLALLTVCGRLPARTRRLLGWMAVVKFAVPIALIARLLALGEDASQRWFGSPTLTLPATWSSAMLGVSADGAAPVPKAAGLIAATVWLAVAVGLLGAWIIRGLRLRRQILADAQPVSATLQPRIEAAAMRAGIRSVPRCLSAAPEHGPGVLGLFSPILILPRGLEETLTPAEFESVLIHECVHLQRRDPLWGAAQAVFGSLLWFHPLGWLLNRRISVETEKSCDERVLAITGDPEAYADGIVKSVRHTLGLAQPGFAGVTTPPVVERIQAILAHGARRDRPLVRHAAIAGGILLLALSGYAGSFDSSPNLSRGNPPVPAAAPLEKAAAPTASWPQATAPDFANDVEPSASSRAARLETPSRAPLAAEAAPPIAVAATMPENPRATETEPAPGRVAADAVSHSAALVSDPALTRAQPVTVPSVVPVPPADATLAPITAPPAPAAAPNPPIVAAVKTAPAPAAALPADKMTAVRIYDLKELDQGPVVKSQAKPSYPLALRRSDIRGEATVAFIVDTGGAVVDAHVINATHKEFGVAALNAVSQWKFKPGRKNGQSVNTAMQVPVLFRIN